MAGPLYIADPAGLFRRVALDGLTAFFHIPSGMTHILAPPAPQILDALADNPADIAEILARMAWAFDLEGDAGALQARLDELEAAGLVRRIDSDSRSPAKAGVQEGSRAGSRLSPDTMSASRAA